ncbi:MAG: glycerol-3-phosphate acyltransferase, partial [Eubacteriales bacterium]
MEYLGYLVLPMLLAAVAGYLLGSINWSIILTRLFKHKEDIRKYGSGNAGMTNVLRTVGKVPAILTFVGDFVKCVAAVLLAYLIMYLAFFLLGLPVSYELVKAGQYIAGMACVMGHIFPVYYGFRGGKGVVASAAMIALLDWRAFLLVIGTFL